MTRYSQMVAHRFIALLTAASMIISPLTAYAQSPDETRLAVTKLTVKFGPQVIKQLRATTEFSVPPSSLPPEKRNQAVEKTYQEYVKLRSTYASAKNSTEWLSLGVGGGTALVAALAGPQATVTIPAILVGATITTMIDIGNERLDAVGRSQMRELLRSRQSDIFQDLGLDYTGFDEMSDDPEEIRRAFSDGIEVFQDLRERADSDAVWENTQEMIVDAIANTTKEQWEAIEVNQDNIELVASAVVDLADELTRFQAEVEDRFTDLEVKYDELAVSIEDLQGAVVNLDSRVGALEKNQAMISDFIFDDMPPARKVLALEGDFFGSRFKCADAETTCEASELKAAMIDRFKKEAEVQELISDVNYAVSSLNSIGKIASDLRISSPELRDAVRIGNAAAGAFAGFMTGNYLGAISSITGLFGKKSDPDAERFKILMKYLQQQFEQVNKKLDTILENQAKIMEAVVELHKEMQRGFQRLDRRLASMDFELTRTSSGVRALIWDKWKSCNAVFQVSHSRDGSGLHRYVDPTSKQFRSSQALQDVLSTHQDAALECLVIMQGNMASLNAQERFGNFVDLRWVIDERLSQASLAAFDAESANQKQEAEEAPDFRSLLEKFEREQFNPIWQRFINFAAKAENPDFDDLFVMLTRPMASTDDWRFGLSQIKDEPFICFESENTNARFSSLLCPPGNATNSPSEVAASMLARPVLADVVVEISNWVLVMSQLADLRIDGEWTSHEELFKLALEDQLPDSSSQSTGELLLEDSVSVIDMAIASYAMTYGPLMAQILLDELEAGGDVKPLIEGSSNIGGNPYLAANLSQLFLEKRFRESYPDADQNRPIQLVYRSAYNLALEDHPGRFLILESLFGTDLNFEVDEKGTPHFSVGADGAKIKLELPPPGEMKTGRVIWPPRYYELLAARERIMDRLISYRVIDDLPEDEQEYMAVTMMQ